MNIAYEIFRVRQLLDSARLEVDRQVQRILELRHSKQSTAEAEEALRIMTEKRDELQRRLSAMIDEES